MRYERPPIDRDRLWRSLMDLAEITEPNRPFTRRSFSPLFLEGRAWLTRAFEDAGMSVRLDAGANLIARLEGSVPETLPIVLGSHSDTVPSGGRFDGAAGILTALEVVHALRDAGHELRHPIEIVDFLAEEPSEYGVSCVGSRAMAGALDDAMLGYTNAAGETLAAAIARVGGDPSRLAEARRSDIVGYVELHIEQGSVLQSNNVELGLVTSIAGILRIELVFEGAADHAGTTPMRSRRDASLAAAELSLWIEQQANEFAKRNEGHFVATTGVLDIAPNAANVVPGRARMIFDIRAERDAQLDEFTAALDQKSKTIAGQRNVTRTRFDALSRTNPTPCDDFLRELLGRCAAGCGHSAMTLASGAGHDAAFVARIAPSAMLFIPCRDGKSHTPEEWAEPDALEAGAATLFETVRLLDGRNV